MALVQALTRVEPGACSLGRPRYARGPSFSTATPPRPLPRPT